MLIQCLTINWSFFCWNESRTDGVQGMSKDKTKHRALYRANATSICPQKVIIISQIITSISDSDLKHFHFFLFLSNRGDLIPYSIRVLLYYVVLQRERVVLVGIGSKKMKRRVLRRQRGVEDSQNVFDQIQQFEIIQGSRQ